jgi:hypothetical protein
MGHYNNAAKEIARLAKKSAKLKKKKEPHIKAEHKRAQTEADRIDAIQSIIDELTRVSKHHLNVDIILILLEMGRDHLNMLNELIAVFNGWKILLGCIDTHNAFPNLTEQFRQIVEYEVQRLHSIGRASAVRHDSHTGKFTEERVLHIYEALRALHLLDTSLTNMFLVELTTPTFDGSTHRYQTTKLTSDQNCKKFRVGNVDELSPEINLMEPNQNSVTLTIAKHTDICEGVITDEMAEIFNKINKLMKNLILSVSNYEAMVCVIELFVFPGAFLAFHGSIPGASLEVNCSILQAVYLTKSMIRVYGVHVENLDRSIEFVKQLIIHKEFDTATFSDVMQTLALLCADKKTRYWAKEATNEIAQKQFEMINLLISYLGNIAESIGLGLEEDGAASMEMVEHCVTAFFEFLADTNTNGLGLRTTNTVSVETSPYDGRMPANSSVSPKDTKSISNKLYNLEDLFKAQYYVDKSITTLSGDDSSCCSELYTKLKDTVNCLNEAGLIRLDMILGMPGISRVIILGNMRNLIDFKEIQANITPVTNDGVSLFMWALKSVHSAMQFRKENGDLEKTLTIFQIFHIISILEGPVMDLFMASVKYIIEKYD